MVANPVQSWNQLLRFLRNLDYLRSIFELERMYCSKRLRMRLLKAEKKRCAEREWGPKKKRRAKKSS
jgi:hypothetical protein